MSLAYSFWKQRLTIELCFKSKAELVFMELMVVVNIGFSRGSHGGEKDFRTGVKASTFNSKV